MSLTPSSPVTGGAQTGFTTPTYTLTADQAPDVNGKQYVVTALGGTQAGVSLHSPANPFTLSYFKPKVTKTLPPFNSATSVLRSVGRNTYKVIVRKGVVPLTGQAPIVANFTLSMDLPAGSDQYDPASIRAAVSLLVGFLSQQSAGAGDSLVTGVI